MIGTYEELAAVRQPAARAQRLAEVVTEVDEGVLLGALLDPFFQVRQIAAEGLRARLDAALASRMVDAVAGRPEGEAAVCMAFARADAPDVARLFLERSLEGAEADVRYEALMALAAVDSAGLESRVLASLERETDVGVLVVCAQLCAQHGWTGALQALERRYDALPRGLLRRNRDRFQFACVLAELRGKGVFLDARVVGEVQRDLVDQLFRDEFSTAASRALAALGERGAVAALSKATTAFGLHPIHRVEAAAALVQLGERKGVEKLREFLAGRRKDARGWAMIQAGRLGLEEFRALVEASARGREYHADTAVLALRLYGDEDARALVGELATGHPDEELRENAREILEHWEEKNVV